MNKIIQIVSATNVFDRFSKDKTEIKPVLLFALLSDKSTISGLYAEENRLAICDDNPDFIGYTTSKE